MREAVDILEVHLAAMPPADLTPAMAHSNVAWYVLTISLRNGSAGPVYLISDIRRIRYDAARRVLEVQLSEHEPLAQGPGVRPPLPPQYRCLGAGEVVTIAHPLSSPITFLDSPAAFPTAAAAARAWRTVRIPDELAEIECTVAYETAPPSPPDNLAGSEMSRKASGRATTVTGVWRAPARPS